MSGPTKNENSTRAEIFEICALIAGAVVVVGLLVESGPELAKSILDCTLPERGVIGSVVVAIGVGAEVIFSWRALNWARKAELEVEAEIARANERASSADLERIKLQSVITRRTISRHLTGEEAEEIVKSMAEFSGQAFAIRTPDISDKVTSEKSSECLIFGGQLTTILKQSGWADSPLTLPIVGPSHGIVIFSGVPLGVTVIGLDNSWRAASALSWNLTRKAISAEVRSRGVQINEPDVLIISVGLL